MKWLALVVVVLIAWAWACGGNGATPSTSTAASGATPPPAPKPAGRVIADKLHSDALGVDKDVRVYVPAGYDGTKRYPVLYYLHGLTGSETNWVELGKLDKVADDLALEAIVVMPDGDNNFYIDSALAVDYDACMRDGTGLFAPQQSHARTCVRASKYETYITRDLVGWVDAHYATIAKREARGIAGLSMGGYGALVLAMRHPDLFAAAASHSGLDSLLYAGPMPYEKGKVTLMTATKDLITNFGDFGHWLVGLYGEDLANWRAHDPAALVDKLQPGQLKLYLDCGTEDDYALHNGMQHLHDLLLAKHIDHEYYIGPGRHDFVFWSQRLPKSLAFLRAAVAPPGAN